MESFVIFIIQLLLFLFDLDECVSRVATGISGLSRNTARKVSVHADAISREEVFSE